MHPLLEPQAISRQQAFERCKRFLRARSRQFVLVEPLSWGQADHVYAVLAFVEILLAAAEAPGPAARRRALGELSEELEAALAGRPGAPLGHALSATVRLKELGAPPFREPLEELRANLERRSFETREAMQLHLQKIMRPLGRALLEACERSSEKNRVLMDALSTAWLAARWTVRIRAGWEQGRLNVPVDELARAGIHLQEIDPSRPDRAWASVVAGQVRWIRDLFHKGWGLSTEIGPWRGRLLSLLLRWHAASLSAVEARGFDTSRGEPPAGLLRFFACTSASLFTRKPPEWSR